MTVYDDNRNALLLITECKLWNYDIRMCCTDNIVI